MGLYYNLLYQMLLLTFEEFIFYKETIRFTCQFFFLHYWLYISNFYAVPNSANLNITKATLSKWHNL